MSNKPMTDERLLVLEEMFRSKEGHELTQEIRRLREDVAWHANELKRVAEAVGIETPLQLTVIAENDEETSADLLVKFATRLREENAELETARGMHAEINRRAAEALGQPRTGPGSSWHDIPAEIAKLRQQRYCSIRASGKELREVLRKLYEEK